MRVVVHLDEDDGVPCVCKVAPILKLFPTATLVVHPEHGGTALIDSLTRARVPVTPARVEPYDRWVVGDHA
jgi:hypothetical protein